MIDLDGTLFVQLGLFFLAFIILHVLIFKPMLRLFEEREKRIDGAKDQAKQLEREAAGAGTEFEDKMREVRLSAQADRDKLRAEGAKTEAKMLAKVAEDTDKQLAEAEAQLEKEAKKLRKEIEAQVPVMAKALAGKLLAREVQ